jgi:DNA-binding response OmpR family regulator
MEYRHTILVIDDDEDFVSGMAALLTAEGHRVISAADCDAAWELVTTRDPDILLVDWNLPVSDGLSFVRRLRASPEHRGRYAIMVTARSEQRDIVRGIAGGADDYLTKPFDNAELLARIGVGLRTRSLERELAEQIRKTTVLEMAGAIAHEIGNPLAAATMLHQRMALRIEAGATPELARELQALGGELRRIELLVRKAQSLTRVQSIPYAADLRIIDIHADDGPADRKKS